MRVPQLPFFFFLINYKYDITDDITCDIAGVIHGVITDDITGDITECSRQQPLWKPLAVIVQIKATLEHCDSSVAKSLQVVHTHTELTFGLRSHQEHERRSISGKHLDGFD